MDPEKETGYPGTGYPDNDNGLDNYALQPHKSDELSIRERTISHGHQQPHETQGKNGDIEKDLESARSDDPKQDDDEDDDDNNKNSPPAAPEKDPNLVVWDGPDDPENPQNMPLWRKWVITMALAFTALWVTFASSVFSENTEVTSMIFHVSTEVMTLGTSLMVLGYMVGPLICMNRPLPTIQFA